MKKLLLGVLIAALALIPSTSFAAVNDFTISNYEIDYYLSKDSEGRSALKTVERITAKFPQIDQNHGIERAIPSTYDGHSTSLNIQSVIDEAGNKLNFTTYGSNDNEVVRIGDADTYVHGSKTYVLTYSQRDVTKYFSDTNDDEFYWDTNGVDWRVPIGSLRVTLHLDETVKGSLNGKTSCYRGFSGASDACILTQEGPSTYSVNATDLAAGENVTIAVGFAPQTFAAYKTPLWQWLLFIWIILTVALVPVGIGVGVWIFKKWNDIRNRKKDVGTIVPEYIPPKDVSVAASANAIDGAKHVMTAQTLDLAVRHYIKIYETKPAGTFKKAEYDMEIIKPIDDLKWEEKELLSDIFSGNTAVGTRLPLKTLQQGTGFYSRIQNNDSGLDKLIKGEYGLRGKSEAANTWFKRAARALLIIGIVLLSPVFFVVSAITFMLGFVIMPLTDKGVELRRYLLGLKDYISVAEEERIRLLQSPEGVSKVNVDATDSAQLIKLYERVLPYAVLFGQEKEWGAQLGKYYETAGTTPDWYVGNNASAFNAAYFASSLNSFASSGTSYQSPSSSGSGGSGGGGSSGGGGGGGGGGGW
jgi:uncharacterized membrane protein YgcG